MDGIVLLTDVNRKQFKTPIKRRTNPEKFQDQTEQMEGEGRDH